MICSPEAAICATEATICTRTADSNHDESTQASSNSVAENAARGPRCSVFLPGWQKTRPWGLSRCSRVAEKARKGAAKREKRQESRRRGPNAMLDPCSEAPWRRFLSSCEQNRATAASRKEKPVKRYEHLTGIRPDALNPLRTQHVYWARKESRTQSAVVCKSILEHPPLKHRFDMALRLFH